MYWSCCFSSFVASIKSCTPPYKIQPYFYVWIQVFFLFHNVLSLSSTYLSTDQLVSYRSRTVQEVVGSNPSGTNTRALFIFSLSMRKGCPRCDEGDKLQVLFHGTLLWYITSSILWVHLFLHVNSVLCRAISCGLVQCEEILKPQAPALKTMIGIQRYSYCQHPYSFVIDLSAKRTAYWWLVS